MENFEYIYPKNLKSIPLLLSKTEGESLLFAGGTDAISRMKEGLIKPRHLVNLKQVQELDYIKEETDGLHIGSITRLTSLLKNKELQKYTGLSEAIQSIATPQIRNMGTIGGNLCQRPRCWYFRGIDFKCLRKGGSVCFAVDGENKYHAIMGEGPCFIVHPSDMAPILIAVDARVTICSPNKERQIALENLYVMPDQDVLHETILSPQEFISEIFVPKTNKKSHYLKFSERKSFDFAMVSIAVVADVLNNTINNIRVVYGGIAPKPWRAKIIEQSLEGKTINNDILEKSGAMEMKNAFPLEKNQYKVILAKNLLKHAVQEMISA